MKRSPLTLARDLFALVGGELLAKIAGFVAFAYLARVLPAESYGSVELAVAVVAVFVLVVDFGFAPIGARELARSPERAAFLAAAIPTLRLALAAASAAVVCTASFAIDAAPATRTLLRWFAASLLFAPWLLNWLFQGLNRLLWVPIAQLVRMGTFAALVVLLVDGASDAWMVGASEFAAAAAMAGYYLAAQALTVGVPKLGGPRTELRKLAVEALPVGASRILWALYQYLSTWLVALLVGGIAVAWFGAAHRLATSLGSFVQLYHFNLYPQLVEAVGQGQERVDALMRPSFRVTAWVGILGGVAGSLVATPLCALLYGEPFAASGPAFALLVWTLPISLVASHARFALIAGGHQRAELAANAAGAAAALATGVALVPFLGAEGGAIAMLAGALATWAVAHVAAQRRVGKLPHIGPLLRPALAGAVAAAIALAAPLAGPLAAWQRMGVAVVVYVGLALLLDRALVRDVRALRARGQGR